MKHKIRITQFFSCIAVLMILTLFPTQVWAGNLYTQLIFDGDDDSCMLENNASTDLLGVPSFTWEAWIYPRTWGGSSMGRIMEIFNINLNTLFFIHSDGSLDARFGYTDLQSAAISDGGYISLNEWNHVVAVHENRNFTLYIDLVEPTYDTYQSGQGTHQSSGTEDWYIGNRYEEDRGFDGYIDEFLFYNRSLSFAEIEYSYNNIEPYDQTDLIWWLRFNEGSGGITYDETANNNDFTLEPDYPSNAPTWRSITPSPQQTISDHLNAAAALMIGLFIVVFVIHMVYVIGGGSTANLFELFLGYIVSAIILAALAIVMLNIGG